MLEHLADDFGFAARFGLDRRGFLTQLGLDAAELPRLGLPRSAQSPPLRGMHTSRLPRRVTCRRTTPGVDVAAASSPLSFPDEMRRSLVTSDRLSRRGASFSITASRPRAPLGALSTALLCGGDAGAGLAMDELRPLAELELFRLRPLASIARRKFIEADDPADNAPVQAPPLVAVGCSATGSCSTLRPCAFTAMGSSAS